MTYIDLINAFEKWLETNYLPSSAQLLWYKLIAIFNKAGWSEWITVDNYRLMSIMQMESEKTLIRCRDKLIENNFFEYQKGKKGSPNKYKINTVNFTAQMTGKMTVQMGVKTTAKVSNINRLRQDKENIKLLQCNDNVTKCNDNKEKDKQNKKDVQMSDKSTSKIEINNNEQKQVLLDHFKLIWDKYPNKKGKIKALEYYLQWIKGRKISSITKKLTDEQMYYAVIRYKKECEEKRIEQQYIKHGDTFFNKAILDYVEEENE